MNPLARHRPPVTETALGWAAGLTVLLTFVALLAADSLGTRASAQTSVAPVLSCAGSMVLDSSSGQCRTPRTETKRRPSTCPSGWTQVSGQYGGRQCQRRVERQRDTGRTRQVYSHTTYDTVWVPTGTRLEQTGTNRVWVPPRTMTEPLVPPVRVRVGTRTESRVVTRPGPDVLYEVHYEVQVETRRVVRRCAFDPFAGQSCWNETIIETRTESRTRLECCIPGPPVRETVTTEVPIYEWRGTQEVTVPGYWRDKPIFSEVEIGYWDRVPTLHYTTESIYETVVEWQTRPATARPCPTGWRTVGRQCERTVLGSPTAAPTQRCPAGTVPRYSDSVGGVVPTVVSCAASQPSTDLDSGDDQEQSGGSETSPDGVARPLHHLAGESDERLAELGIHRCSNGLLSYVPCSELPGREWDDDPSVCDGLDGTVFRPDHGGSCVTGSDLLTKCTVADDCEQTTIRTYCPAIGELVNTEIQEHVHPARGAETYRVCVFDCGDFGTLPSYVQHRIDGSYDYACRPESDPDGDEDGEDGDEDDGDEDDGDGDEDDGDGDGDEDDGDGDGDDGDGDGDDGDGEDADDERDEDNENDDEQDGDGADNDVNDVNDDGDGDGDVVGDENRPIGDVPIEDDSDGDSTPEDFVGDDCSDLPAVSAVLATDGDVEWVSFVRSADGSSGLQDRMPGSGRYLQVAPGRGWMELRGSLDVRSGECTWIATRLRATWSELRPWVASERRQIAAGGGMGHLIDQWDVLSDDQQQLVRQWHTRSAVPHTVECTASDAALTGDSACRWLLRRPAAFAWRSQVCFELVVPPAVQLESTNSEISVGDDPQDADACWLTIAEGVNWIRSVDDYADARLTVTAGGGQR